MNGFFQDSICWMVLIATTCIHGASILSSRKKQCKMLISLFPTVTIIEESLQENPKKLLYNNYVFL